MTIWEPELGRPFNRNIGTLIVMVRAAMRRIYDTEGDWGKLLQSFAQAAQGQ